MAGDETTTVLDEAGTSAVKLMLSKLNDYDVTVVFEIVGGVGPIGDLAAWFIDAEGSSAPGTGKPSFP